MKISILLVVAFAIIGASASMSDTTTIMQNNFVSSAFLSLVPGENAMTLDRPEGTRNYYVYLPKSYNPANPAPLLFAFHGLGDTCQSFGDEIGFKPFAEQYGFIFVYPCGYSGPIGTAWNAGTCCLSGSSVDDVAFTKAMIAAISAVATIDKSRIYSSGFSNGAMFSEILACEAPDVFRAVASVSGVVEIVPGNAAGLATCDSDFAKFNTTISVLAVHGDGDPVVPWGGNAILGFPDQPTNFADWSKRVNCTGTPVQTINNGTFTNQIYQDCEGGVQIELVKNEGGAHMWPQGGDFDATTYIWSFFERVSSQ